MLSQHQDPLQQPDPGGAFHPEEYQTVFHEAHWAALRTRPYLWGKFIWNVSDSASDTRSTGQRSEPWTSAPDLKVHSNLPRVRLRVNGAKVGELSAGDHIFRGPGTPLQQGPNPVAVAGKGADGALLTSDNVT